MSGADGAAEQVLAELASVHDPEGDPELEALKLALLLEDSLGVVLGDDDVDRLRQDGPAAAGGIVGRARRERS